MKLSKNEQEAIVTGNANLNEVSIDEENIGLLMTFISSQLYSNPIPSFIRETISNAWDSHVEANNSDPVILELGENTEGKYYCRIQDFGTGISKERFDSIYRKALSSTKRQDNKQIGGFGVGKFAGLSYSDVYYITSVHNGIEYKYMMMKDGDSISIPSLSEIPTDQPNGVEVYMPLKSKYDITSFRNAIKDQLVYFENVYVIDSVRDVGSSIEKEFNDFKIKKFKNFSVNTLNTQSSVDIILGKVRYPLRFSSLKKNYSDRHKSLPISLNFNIGDLRVPPNREEIVYSASTISKIEEVLDEAIKEVEDIMSKEVDKDFTDLEDYVKAIKNSDRVILFEHNDNLVTVKVLRGQRHLTLNGKSYKEQEFEDLHNSISCIACFSSYAIVGNNRIKSDTRNHSIQCLIGSVNFPKDTLSDSYRYSNKYFVNTEGHISDLNSHQKAYLRDTYDELYLLNMSKNSPLKVYRRIYKGLKNDYRFRRNIIDSKIVNLLVRHYFSQIYPVLGVIGEDFVDQEWIDERKRQQKLKRQGRTTVDWKQNISLHVVRKSAKSGWETTYDRQVHNLKELKGLIVYSNVQDERLKQMFPFFHKHRHITFAGIGQTKIKLIENLKNFVSMDQFLNPKYRNIKKIGTLKYIKDNYPHILDLHKIKNLDKISVKLKEIVNRVHEYCEEAEGKADLEQSPVYQEIYDICEKSNYFDHSILSILKGSNALLVKNSQFLLLMAERASSYGYYNEREIPDNRINLCVDFCLSRRLFRPDLSAVEKLKEETILNIK